VTARRRREPVAPRRPAQAPGPRRSPFALIAIGLAVVIIAAGSWWLMRERGGFELPADAAENVLLVTIDTLRADALSSYGGSAQTPNLDRLASHGARFTSAHAHAVVTLVSHTSILTGKYPYQTGVRDNAGFRVAPDTVTLATRLKAQGFRTGAFIGAFPLTKRFGLTLGFDDYDDQIPEVRGAVDFALPERRADAVVTRALDWIGTGDQKFFAWVHVFDPHAPYAAPEQFAKQYPGAPYRAEVAWTDSALGTLFDRLAMLPRKTLVIVTGDHGEGLGDHGEMTHGLFAYESTLKIPLIVAEVDPKATSLPRGRVVTLPVRHVDIVPTVLDGLSMPADTTLPGSSLRGVISGRSDGDRPAYFEAMTGFLTRGWAPLRGVIAGGDKFIDLPVRELYRLLDDPTEQRNQASVNPGRVEVLTNTLGTFDRNLPGLPKRESAEVSQQLGALGYTAGGTRPLKSAFTDADDPKNLISLDRDLHAANDYYSTGRYAEAIKQFESVIAQRPDLVDAYRYMAFVYWQMGQPGAAIKTLERTITRGIADQDVRTRLATFLAETGQPAKGVALLAGAPSDDVEAQNALGIAYGQAGRDADAIAAFERVLAVEATNGIALQNIGTIRLRQNNLRDAETYVRRALAADPSLANAYTTLGVIFQRSNQMDNAIESWRRAVELDGTEFDALFNLTIALAQRGARAEATAFGERFLATAPPAFYGADLVTIKRLLGR
jgi:arylsulfatase A-like enzyme/tetratricopeptide (TPR) repeat protein